MRRLSPLLLRLRLLGALLATLGAAPGVRAAETAAPPNGIAIAVVFDTSGSMRAAIPTKAGRKPEAKIVIAQRAFGAVIDRLQTFARSSAARPLSVGVYVFDGMEAKVAVPLSPFDPARLRQWLVATRTESSTPLGEALFLAGRDLLAAPVAARHLLVLTDGANTTGRTPETALAQINEASSRKQTSVFAHIIALDIKPAVFAALKQQGATLIGATNEAQLNIQFDFILEHNILVEAPR